MKNVMMNGPIKDLRMSLSNFFITKAGAYLVSLNVLTYTKITLSPDELQLVNNSDWILTKRMIIDAAVHLFSGLANKTGSILEKEKDWLPLPVLLSEPKISKGESYQQLPYVILDHPRCFDATNIFAIRTMFWWGNFFSCTLHLSGSYKKLFEEALIRNMDVFKKAGYYICINEDQWQHHFETGNYAEMNTRSEEEIKAIITQQPFIKIARRFPLQQWNEMPALLERSFSELLLQVKN